CWADADGDSFRTDRTTLSADLDCFDPGEADAFAPPGDCDDTLAQVRPGAPEVIADRHDNDCDGFELCYRDADADGWLSASERTIPSEDMDCADAGEAIGGIDGDCDDDAPSVHPTANEIVDDGVDSDCDGGETCWTDNDGDGFRTAVPLRSADLDCLDPGEGTAELPAGDCDDRQPAVHPEAEEQVGNGRDEDCTGTELCWADADRDGFRTGVAIASADVDCADAGEAPTTTPEGDCNDNDPRAFPGATEHAGDNTDSDCDGTELCYRDADDDGWISLASPTLISLDADCNDASESAGGIAGDCDDALAAVHPGATEQVGDGADQDCDGGDACWTDLDGDGFHSAVPVPSADLDCEDLGETTDAIPGGDCDDRSADHHPGAEDIVGDGVDSDCDGAESCWVDRDRDGFRAIDPQPSPDTACNGPGEVSAALPGGDCDDGTSTTFPSATERAGDGIDADCDGGELCYVDLDGDGWLPTGAPTVVSPDLACDAPGEADDRLQVGDCEDADADVFPGQVEIPADGIDSDCDGGDLCWVDADGDGFRALAPAPSDDLDCTGPGEAAGTLPGGDCDDDDIATFPGAPETTGDGIDSACDGNEQCFVDADADGWLADAPATVLSADGDCNDPGEAPPGAPRGDCDDTRSEVHPGATDVSGSRIDENCDGLKSCLQDVDSDGYLGSRPGLLPANDADCDDPGEAWADAPAGDCNDNEPSVHPGAIETPGDTRDSDCDGLELCRQDQDDDGFYVTDGPLTPSTDLRCRGEGFASGNALPGDCDDLDRDLNPFADEEVDDGIDQDCDGRETCYADLDNDGYRARQDGTVVSDDFDCHGPGEATQATPRNDCDDTIAEVHPGAAEIPGNLRDEDCNGGELCFDDDDGDGFIDTSGDTRNSADLDCRDPNEADLNTPATDCDDTRPDISPVGRELRADGIDGNCDGKELCFLDVDDDGYLSPTPGDLLSDDADCTDPFEGALVDPTTDCDDQDASRNPSAPEIPANGVDEDCDDADACYDDDDGDGFLDATGDIRPGNDFDCLDEHEGDAFTPTSDCDDDDPADNPDAVEIVGNGDDEDCDGQEICLADHDDDGFTDGSGDTIVSSDADCDDPFEATYATPATDCDDEDAARHPGADEIPGDEVDSDCDTRELCFVDADRDGHAAGDGATIVASDGDCDDRGEATADIPQDDCDDANAARHPGGDEIVGDEIDGDCDGTELCFLDADADHVLDGDGDVRLSGDLDCRDQFEGSLLTPVGDCDDTSRAVRPGAPETPGDGVDSDCDGAESCFADGDGDGWRTDALVPGNDADCDDPGEATVSMPSGDCDDRSAATHPGAVDLPADGRDSNCDGGDPCFADEDDDGWRTDLAAFGAPDGDCDDPGEARRNDPSGDCDDDDRTIHPQATEDVGDGVDQDCDGRERCRRDGDGDGWTTAEVLTSDNLRCDGPGESPSASVSPDCDDARADVNPGRVEVVADGVDQNCDGR
ncbi:MAG TPA: MopE-related protein, partial [Myxococcota bacterium]|nr:MopE-related protein [Myxococcota bacterium]